MKLHNIQYKEIAPDYHVVLATIKIGITKLYTINDFKTKVEAEHFKQQIEKDRENVLNKYYFFPRPYLVSKKIVDKWYDICDIRFRLFAKKD